MQWHGKAFNLQVGDEANTKPQLIIRFLTLAEVLGNDCQRQCNGSLPRQCVYNFHVQYYYTMSKACYDCPLVSEDCDRPHCIAADSVERGIIVVNRQLPGPSIQVLTISNINLFSIKIRS